MVEMQIHPLGTGRGNFPRHAPVANGVVGSEQG